ncbi:Uncharacterised protein [Campylobacter hyointestinalis]|uniref:hypothetical protein n=1 Tax=Campylobacter hyointestinalis TaxID=198 RepID=UPI0007264280|nr:hypothetical protein [Campylobacter hyointestinalis]PPB54436.1 hypothetical protein CDQ69_03215 [Campylobacter hyointestinalis subsp. hyointestinalis]PPB63414.1 hypothetical protein CDQ72_00235 [Campylobacter hyointestinalis subsp. hyointestinalis]PPB64963.1 hypothetical protein CDQ73_02615 [Campylobacter hyointestinalis subsp. hyointestinalis]TWO19351.1 hypothetical protein YZ80_07160 [Campylobacter hyointestinalis]CUU69081.1 Uncharacterised protein [Campylobacter hyointestinalis subsp. hy
MKKIVVLGGARDFHAMTWYRSIQKNAGNCEVVFLSDLIAGEGYDNIIVPTDKIEKLFIIDKFLFRKQSKLGNIWRNIFKLLVLPIQIYKLRQFYKKNINSIFHAHPMYYMVLCWLCRIKFIGSPQGDEILIRPKKSILYRIFAIKALRAAQYVIVDSQNMKNEIKKLSGVEALVHQYGIDTIELQKYKNTNKNKITSIRGMLPLYRIDQILDSRECCKIDKGINFIYPYYEDNYLKNMQKRMNSKDIDCGRLNKQGMYDLLSNSFLAISIPVSDSSPRSVYEAIFLGCCVAITYNLFIESLPKCMRDRIIIVDLNDKKWLQDAIQKAKEISKSHYTPSVEAINMFDQDIAIKRVIDSIYMKEI